MVVSSEFSNVREKSNELYEESIAAWVFDEPKYTTWLENKSQTSQSKRILGSNVLWSMVCLLMKFKSRPTGNPASGKTILASSVINELKKQEEFLTMPEHGIYYFFFKYDSPTANSATAAYKFVLAQILWHFQDDEVAIDRFIFAIMHKPEGQSVASQAVLLDPLQLFLNKRSILGLGKENTGTGQQNSLKLRCPRTPRPGRKT